MFLKHAHTYVYTSNWIKMHDTASKSVRGWSELATSLSADVILFRSIDMLPETPRCFAGVAIAINVGAVP